MAYDTEEAITSPKDFFTNRTTYTAALNKFGITNQIIMFSEEYGELAKELSKYNRGKGDKEKICEEIADVQIVLNQLKVYFGEELAHTNFNVKLKRLKKTIEG